MQQVSSGSLCRAGIFIIKFASQEIQKLFFVKENNSTSGFHG